MITQGTTKDIAFTSSATPLNVPFTLPHPPPSPPEKKNGENTVVTVVLKVHFKCYFLAAYKATLRSTVTVFNVTYMYSTGTREIQINIISLLWEVTQTRKTPKFVMKP